MFVASWSGGKDSCYAVMQAIAGGKKAGVLLNVMSEEGQISRSHGIPKALLQKQADAAGIPLLAIPSSWETYEANFVEALCHAQREYGVSEAVFGDLGLQPHRDWEEKVCAAVGLEPVLPLWGWDRAALVRTMIAEGLEAVIVSCNVQMGPSFLGRTLDLGLVEELERLNIDPCGENGEFHTLVVNCPLFSERLEVRLEGHVQHDNYWLSEFAS